jgi:hypothetical protein
VTIHNPAEYEEHLAGFMEAFAPFEGRVLVAREDVEVLKEHGSGLERSFLYSPP